MERLCFTFEIVEGAEEEYDRLHREIWPELANAIVDAGYRNYSLFRRGRRVICVCECHPDVESVRRRSAALHQDVIERWNVLMEPLIARMTDDEGQLVEYALCLHLDEDVDS